MMVFDSHFAPIVGQQVTLTDDNEAEASPRITLLRTRALQDECQLIARDADNEGYLFDGSVYIRDHLAGLPCLDMAAQRGGPTLLIWCQLQWLLIRQYMLDADAIIVMSGDYVVTKSGKMTYGLGRFFSSYNNANLSMFMVNVSQALMRPMRAQWPAFSVNDLKAWFRGRQYVIETLQLLPVMPDAMFIEQVVSQMAEPGRVNHAVNPA
jgi:hypothetical protein